MKGTSKKLLCALLAFVLTFSVIWSVGFSAAQTEDPAPAAADETEASVEAEEAADLAPVAYEPSTEAPAETDK